MKVKFIKYFIYLTFSVIIIHARDNISGEIIDIDNDMKVVSINTMQMGLWI